MFENKSSLHYFKFDHYAYVSLWKLYAAALSDVKKCFFSYRRPIMLMSASKFYSGLHWSSAAWLIVQSIPYLSYTGPLWRHSVHLLF